MFRPLLLSASALAVLTAVYPAVAADSFAYPPELRGAFPDDYDMSDEADPVEIETGVRYWYAWGQQNLNVGGDNFTSNDQSHLLEGTFRIRDLSTGTYVKGLAGYSAVITGTYSDPMNPAGGISDGRIMYGGADLGYLTFGDGKSGAGVLIGYQYWNDSPDTGRANFTTAESVADIGWSETTGAWTVGFDSQENNIDVHALRLGVTARGDFGWFSVEAEAAAVPYAWVNGQVGAFEAVLPGAPPGFTRLQGSPANIDGWGYGGMGEVMLGFHPTENLNFRVGGRAWYLQGTYDARYRTVLIGDPTDADPIEPPPFDTGPTFAEQWVVETNNPFSLFRYGLLAEVTYSF